MPRSADEFDRIREVSRDRILAGALRVFARHGFAATSIRMVAREAGVSQGLMYNYFESKEVLLREIFRRNLALARGSLELSAPSGDPADRLETLIRSVLRLVGENLEFWRLTYSLRMQPAALQSSVEDLRGWTDTVRGEIESALIAAGVSSAGAERAALFALLDGVSQHLVMAPRRYPLGEVTEVIVARYRKVASGGADG